MQTIHLCKKRQKGSSFLGTGPVTPLAVYPDHGMAAPCNTPPHHTFPPQASLRTLSASTARPTVAPHALPSPHTDLGFPLRSRHGNSISTCLTGPPQRSGSEARAAPSRRGVIFCQGFPSSPLPAPPRELQGSARRPRGLRGRQRAGLGGLCALHRGLCPAGRSPEAGWGSPVPPTVPNSRSYPSPFPPERPAAACSRRLCTGAAMATALLGNAIT